MTPKDSRSDPAAARLIDDQAMRWFMALRDISRAPRRKARLRRAFARWRAADPARAAAYERCERDWHALAPLDARYRVTARRRRAWPRLAAVASVLVVVSIGSGLWRHAPSASPSLQIDSGQSPIAALALADGSTLAVDRRTVFEVRLDAHERHVNLEKGSVFFDIAADPTRLFVIETPQGQVRVVGTAFEVEVWREGTQVTVARGEVAVQDGRAGPVALVAGQQVAIDGGGMSDIGSVDAASVAAWREGRIRFVETPLVEVARLLARHHTGGEIHLAPTIEHLEVSLLVQLDDAEQALYALPKVLPVRVYALFDGLHIVPR